MDSDEYDDSTLDAQELVEALQSTEAALAQGPRASPTELACAVSIRPSPSMESVMTSGPSLNSVDVSDALAEAEHAAFTQVDGSGEQITMSRAQLEELKRLCFLAGHQQKVADKCQFFRFLDLPAELRHSIYEHYFQDRNPLTRGNGTTQPRKASALPIRMKNPQCHCCDSSAVWCGTQRPWISTNLLCTCKQVYSEARDAHLYRNVQFTAEIGHFDGSLKVMSPALRFWQWMQHLDLHIDQRRCVYPTFSGARYETGNAIVHLVAMLRNGERLRSFSLDFYSEERNESIVRFRDLKINGAVRLTQMFRDSVGVGQKQLEDRKAALERLLLNILGCASYEAPPYDFVVSTRPWYNETHPYDLTRPNPMLNVDGPMETHVTITSGFD